MKHAREDYNRIQDTSGLIPDDEPVFLIRGQDKHASAALGYYAGLVARDGGDKKIIEAIFDQACAMQEWQKEHGSKSPDIPK